MQMRAVSNYSEIHPFPADLSGNLFSQLFPWLQIFFIKCQTIIKYFSTIQIIMLPVIYQVHGIFCFCKLFSFIFYPVKFQHFKHFLNVLSTFVIKKRSTFLRYFSFNHEASGTRTPDNLIKSQVLYHLS